MHVQGIAEQVGGVEALEEHVEQISDETVAGDNELQTVLASVVVPRVRVLLYHSQNPEQYVVKQIACERDKKMQK